jgi:hypothetical protein
MQLRRKFDFLPIPHPSKKLPVSALVVTNRQLSPSETAENSFAIWELTRNEPIFCAFVLVILSSPYLGGSFLNWTKRSTLGICSK